MEKTQTNEMTAHQLTEILFAGGQKMLDCKVRLLIHSPGAIGPSPSVAVINAQYGFDWDTGTFHLATQEKLTTLSPEDVAAIRSSVSKGQSWHAYQSQKALRERIAELQSQNAQLQKQCADQQQALNHDEWRKGAQFALDAIAQSNTQCRQTHIKLDMCIKQAASKVMQEYGRRLQHRTSLQVQASMALDPRFG